MRLCTVYVLQNYWKCSVIESHSHCLGVQSIADISSSPDELSTQVLVAPTVQQS